ncbi:hypothetical protein ACHAWC_008598 [Mediolabrus comicus]
MITEDSITLVSTSSSGHYDEDDDDDLGRYAKFGRPLTNHSIKFYHKNDTQRKKELGGISGVSVNRQAIGTHGFFETFDEHSGDLEWVGCSLLENKYGRTRLQSLREAGDDPEFDFFLIESFWIDQDQDDPCALATFALRKFLHSDMIKGNLPYGCWNVSSIAYALHDFGEDEQHSGSGKRKREDDGRPSYEEAIPFFRNGFFQDVALLQQNPDNGRILVAGVEHMDQPLKSEASVMPAIKSLRSRLSTKKPTRKDGEILNRVEQLVSANALLVCEQELKGISAAMIGNAIRQPVGDVTTTEQLQSLRRDLSKLVGEGGSIARSTALHIACEKNSIKVVKLLLELDASSISAKDRMGRTPLIVATMNACGRRTINGIDETQVIDNLLNAGARKEDVDSVGLTAYGHFEKYFKKISPMASLQHNTSLTDLEHKLYPPGGPTAMDFSNGKGGSSGIVDYGPEDEEERRLYGGSDDDGDY